MSVCLSKLSEWLQFYLQLLSATEEENIDVPFRDICDLRKYSLVQKWAGIFIIIHPVTFFFWREALEHLVGAYFAQMFKKKKKKDGLSFKVGGVAAYLFTTKASQAHSAVFAYQASLKSNIVVNATEMLRKLKRSF